MSLFAKLAEKTLSLSDQLTPELHGFIEVNLAKVQTAIKEYTAARIYVSSLSMLAQAEDFYFIKLQPGQDAWKDGLFSQFTTIKRDVYKKLFRQINSTYLLDVKFDDKIVEEAPLETNDFLRYYFESGKISSLNESGIGKVKDEFLKYIWYQARVRVAGKSVTLIDQVHHEFYQRRTISYNSRDRMVEILKGLSLFDSKKLGSFTPVYDQIFGGKDIYDMPIVLESIPVEMETISSVQFFKNGNLKLTFKNPGLAKQFIEYFGINNLKKERN